MNFSVATHSDAKNPKGFIHYDDVEFSDIPKMVMSGCLYSAGKFKDGHRKNNSWHGCVDVLILDIDDGCNIKQAMSIFSKYEHYIITTRSHKKDKNGFACDRFRIFLNLIETVNDPDIMDNLMATVMSIFNFVDKSTKDRGRMFFPSPEDAEVYYTEGKKMPIIITKQHVEVKKEPQPIKYTSDDVYKFCELTNMWRDKNGNELESTYNEGGVNYEAKLKGIRVYMNGNFYDGNKHCCLVNCIYMMRNDSFDDDYIINFLYDECSKRIPVKVNDIVRIARNLK